MVTVLICLTALAGWFVLVIWGAWSGRWILAGLAGLLYVFVLVRVGIALNGPKPGIYGPVIGVSLFLTTGLLVIGAIYNVVVWLARHRDR